VLIRIAALTTSPAIDVAFFPIHAIIVTAGRHAAAFETPAIPTVFVVNAAQAVDAVDAGVSPAVDIRLIIVFDVVETVTGDDARSTVSRRGVRPPSSRPGDSRALLASCRALGR